MGPLEEAAATALVASQFPQLNRRTRQQLVADARGNPLALLELLRRVPDDPASARPAPAAQRILDLYGARIDRLPAAARRSLLIAALDETDDLDVATHLEAAAPGALKACEQAGLVSWERNSRRLAFSHPLIRAASTDNADEDERRAAHRELAAVLASRLGRRAWHLAEATTFPNDPIADLLVDLAQQMRGTGDTVGAVRTLTRAASLTSDRTHRGRRLARAAYLGADSTGDVRAVARLLATARDADPGRAPFARGGMRGGVFDAHSGW